MKKEKEYVPNHVYFFDLSLKLDPYPFRVQVPTKIIKEGWDRVDEFNNDEEEVKKAYFTQEVIDEYKWRLIEMIQNMKNPFNIYCNDTDGDYMYTEDDLFRKPE